MIRAMGVDALRAEAQKHIDAGWIPSCQFALGFDGEVVVSETLGDAPADARYQMMSSTKPVFASVVLQLIGEGKLDPALPIVHWWPEFGAHGKDVITLEQVLVFTCGLPNATVDITANRESRAAQMEAWTLAYEPGTQYRYHGLSAHWILAELVARVTGADHREALRERVLDPLGLKRLEIGVPPERQEDVRKLVPSGEPAGADELAAAVKERYGVDLPDSILEALGPTVAVNADDDLFDHLTSSDGMAAGVPGGGGVTDAASLALFYQALLHNPHRLWDPAVLGDATTNVRNRLPDELGRPAMRSLGFEFTGDDDEPRVRFGHGGAFGQLSWADPTTGLSFAFLTNGVDRNIVRQYQRDFDLHALAAGCVE